MAISINSVYTQPAPMIMFATKISLCVAALGVSAQAQPLLILPVPEGMTTVGSPRLSQDGHTVCFSASTSASSGSQFIYRWRDNAIESLGIPPGSSGLASLTGVDSSGDVVVGRAPRVGQTSPTGFFWRGGTLETIGSLSEPSGRSSPAAVSRDGGVVVGYADSPSGNQAFRWSATAGISGLGYLPGFLQESFAHATNLDGTVVVGTAGRGITTRAVRWSPEGIHDLGLVGAYTSSSALAVSSDGNRVFGYLLGDRGTKAAFEWSPTEGMRQLATMQEGYFTVDPIACSESGEVMIARGQALTLDPHLVFVSGQPGRGFSTVLRELGIQFPPQSFISSITSVSGDGTRIAGQVSLRVGNVFEPHVFVVTIPTATPSAGLLAVALLAIRTRRPAAVRTSTPDQSTHSRNPQGRQG